MILSRTSPIVAAWVLVAVACAGCSTMKESFTPRTGIEQLLISSATDRALDQINFRNVARAKIFVETKYLDCTDKNYIIVALRQRLLEQGCTLVDKVEEADVVMEVASGGIGTDGNELYVGIPAIPLPPPSPIQLPQVSLFKRTRSIGTAKLTVIAYDARTREPVINSGYALARADHRTVNVLGAGGFASGSVHDELNRRAGNADSLAEVAKDSARPIWR
jgi:hypothetical protein